jgi:hypothetical protein
MLKEQLATMIPTKQKELKELLEKYGEKSLGVTTVSQASSDDATRALRA